MQEEIDILNEKREKTGEIRTINDVHIFGLFHCSVDVWLLNSKRQLLLQKRSKNMQAYPGYWYNSASGHISAGQSSLETAQKETQEELGIFLPLSSFQYLFTCEKHTVLNEGTYINNEFSDVYLVHCDLSLSEFKIDNLEVEEIKWIDIKELKKWTKGEGELLVPHQEEYKKLFEYLGVIHS